MSHPILRLATAEDLPALNAIYNHYVLHSTATYQTTPETEAARLAWFHNRNLAHHPVVVAEQAGRIAAWGSLSPFGKREAFAKTVENSIYVHPDCHRRGLGRLLLQDQLQRAAAAGHRALIAAISSDQAPSLALHRTLHFAEVGRLLQVGWKFDQWLDLVYLQRLL